METIPILYHWTNKENVKTILRHGLRCNKIGIVYLTPIIDREKLTAFVTDDDVCLRVKTKGLKLTAFDDCEEWEVLCWGNIEPKRISDTYS